MARLVGLSGGIGSGKSTVARMFEEQGATVIDADAIVHELQAPGMPLLAEIAEAFGSAIIGPDGALDRKALGAIVFRDEAARTRLGQLVHPKVGAEMVRRIGEAMKAGAELVLLDIPLLFEGRKAGTGTAASLAAEATVLVYVPEAVQVERTMARDRCDRDEALRRIRAQLPIEEKKAMADHVIDNSGSLEESEAQVRELIATLRSGARRRAPPSPPS